MTCTAYAKRDAIQPSFVDMGFAILIKTSTTRLHRQLGEQTRMYIVNWCTPRIHTALQMCDQRVRTYTRECAHVCTSVRAIKIACERDDRRNWGRRAIGGARYSRYSSESRIKLGSVHK